MMVKNFSQKKACESYESWLRGKELVEKCHIDGELKFYFKATDIAVWEDALKFLSERLYNDFKHYNNFSDFAGNWVFTYYDQDGEFYKLKTAEETIKCLEAEIDALSIDLDRIHSILKADNT